MIIEEAQEHKENSTQPTNIANHHTHPKTQNESQNHTAIAELTLDKELTPEEKEESKNEDSTDITAQNTLRNKASDNTQATQDSYKLSANADDIPAILQKVSELQIINEDPYLKPYESYIKERINKMNQ
jgi:hypothetical protein